MSPARLPNDAVCAYSHTLHSNFHYETYIGISPYRTLAVVELQSMEAMSYTL